MCVACLVVWFRCFVCDIERSEFDKASRDSFDTHIKKDHYMWHYLYMVAYLQFKPRTELTGVEQYLLGRVSMLVVRCCCYCDGSLAP